MAELPSSAILQSDEDLLFARTGESDFNCLKRLIEDTSIIPSIFLNYVTVFHIDSVSVV
jgi:hypothetical protein